MSGKSVILKVHCCLHEGVNIWTNAKNVVWDWEPEYFNDHNCVAITCNMHKALLNWLRKTQHVVKSKALDKVRDVRIAPLHSEVI